MVQLVTDETSQFHHHANELEIIRDFIQKYCVIFVHHTFREGNICAYFLEKMGYINLDLLIMLQESPSSLSSTLLVDVLGVSFVRT